MIPKKKAEIETAKKARVSLNGLFSLFRYVSMLVLVFIIAHTIIPYDSEYNIQLYFRKYYQIEEMPGVKKLEGTYFMENIAGFESARDYFLEIFSTQLFNSRFTQTVYEYEQLEDKKYVTITDYIGSNPVEVGFVPITPFRLLFNFNQEGEKVIEGFPNGKLDQKRTEAYNGMEYDEKLEGYPEYLKTIGSKSEDFQSDMEQLLNDEELFGRLTKSTEFSLAFYHPAYRLVTFVELSLEFTLEGYVERSSFIGSFFPENDVSLGLVLPFFILFGYGFIIDLVQLYQKIRNIRVSAETESPKKKPNSRVALFLVKWGNCFLSFFVVKLKKVVLGFNEHYFRNLLQVFELILQSSLISLVVKWANYTKEKSELRSLYEGIGDLSDLGESGVGPEGVRIIRSISLDIEAFMLLFATLALVLTFKILSNIMGMVSTLQTFFNEVLNAVKNLFPFLILYMNIQLAFTLFFHYYFGRKLDYFSDFWDSLIHTLGLVFGNSNPISEMAQMDFFVTFLSISAYFVVVIYVYSSLFFVFLKNDTRFYTGFTKPKTKETIQIQSTEKFLLYSLWDELVSKTKGVWVGFKRLVLRKKAEEDSGLSKRISEIQLEEQVPEDFDKKFKEDFLRLSQTAFEDEKTEKMRQMKEKKKLVAAIWELVVIALVIGVLVVINILTVDVGSEFESFKFYESTIVYASVGDKSLDELSTMYDALNHSFSIADFVCKGGANVSEIGDQKPLNDQITLLFNENKNYDSTETSFLYDIFPYYSARPTKSQAFFKFWDKEATFTKMLADEKEFFYSIQLDCSNSSRRDTVASQFLELLNSGEFSFSFVNLLIFLEDLEQNQIIRGELVYDFKKSNELDVYYIASVFNMEMFSGSKAISRLVLQILLFIYMLFLFHHIFSYFKKKYLVYSLWYSFEVEPIPLIAKQHRAMKTPELVRRVFAIVDFRIIVRTSVAFLLLVYFLLFSLVFISFKEAIEFKNSADSLGNMAIAIQRVLSNLKVLTMLSSIVIFFMTIQAFQVLGKFKELRVIIGTFRLLSLRLIPLLVILAFTIMGYSMWLYLSPNFYCNTMTSILYNLVMYIQDLEDSEIIQERNKVFFVFVFYIPFFIGVKFILLNILLVMNLSSYRTAFEQNQKTPCSLSLTFKEFLLISLRMLSLNRHFGVYENEFNDFLSLRIEKLDYFAKFKQIVKEAEAPKVESPDEWASKMGLFILKDWKKVKTMQNKIKRVLLVIVKASFEENKAPQKIIEKSLSKNEQESFYGKLMETNEFWREFYQVVAEHIDDCDKFSNQVNQGIENYFKDNKEELELDEEIRKLEETIAQREDEMSSGFPESSMQLLGPSLRTIGGASMRNIPGSSLKNIQEEILSSSESEDENNK